MSEFIYEIKSTKRSSEYFGVCEVCKQHATEVFYQKKYVPYFSKLLKRMSKSLVSSLFGHENCLLSQRTES